MVKFIIFALIATSAMADNLYDTVKFAEHGERERKYQSIKSAIVGGYIASDYASIKQYGGLSASSIDDVMQRLNKDGVIAWDSKLQKWVKK